MPATRPAQVPVTTVAAILCACLLSGCAGRSIVTMPRDNLQVQLPSGAAEADVYWPASQAVAPLVIVAHGFSRNRRNMAGWGQLLAAEGFVAVVPDLPTWSDHARNGRFLTELRVFLLSDAAWRQRFDAERIGLLGFSAGGLSSLLSMAESPGPVMWIGLDPVDRDGLGVRAAATVQAEALVLTAEPSSCNADGNATAIAAALPRGRLVHIAGAVHVDAEWPTSWLAELVCGRSTAEKRASFRLQVTQALQQAFR